MEELALESDILDPEEKAAILRAQSEGDSLPPSLERRLQRAATKARGIIRISQEPMSLEMPVGSEESGMLGDFIEDETIYQACQGRAGGRTASAASSKKAAW